MAKDDIGFTYQDVLAYIEYYDITMKEFCERAGITVQTMGSFKRGKRRMNEKSATKVKILLWGKENIIPEPCTDCFAYYEYGSNKHRCRVLDVKYCQGDTCSTYRTKEQIEKERIKNNRRLRSLPKYQQEHIKNKYKIEF